MSERGLLDTVAVLPLTLGPLPLLCTGLLVLVVYFYFKGLPKPLPGIPYDEASTRSFFGDLPTIVREGGGPNGMWPWLLGRTRRHNSPLVQIFFAPFIRPVLFLSDYREAYDIAARRTKEFDRSSKNADVFGAIIPEHHISMMTADPRFKRNKDLVKDLMTPAFLNEVKTNSPNTSRPRGSGC